MWVLESPLVVWAPDASTSYLVSGPTNRNDTIYSSHEHLFLTVNQFRCSSL